MKLGGTVDDLADSRSRMLAQADHLRDDGRLLESAAIVVEATPAERLREGFAMARAAAALLARLPPDVEERARGYREEPASGAGEILLRLSRHGWPGEP
ncbi:MAG: hypothetical protein EXR72_22655 [Myxococcales bacterium]|nr:hypothetical protein [Myxococcales bacterium]